MYIEKNSLFKLILLLSIWNSVFAIDLKKDCRCRIKIRNRIVGGIKSHPHAYPWAVTISSSGFTNQTNRLNVSEEYKAKSSHLCGGVLINENTVLTAAHCIINRPLSVGFGNENDLVKIFDAGRIAVSRSIVHPRFNAKQELDNDIALLQLEHPIKFSDTVSPACLELNTYDKIKSKISDLFMVGFGHSDVLRQEKKTGLMKDKAVSNRFLKESSLIDISHLDYECINDPNKLCVIHKSLGDSTCNGGPIHYLHKGKLIVLGVNSFGFKNDPIDDSDHSYFCSNGTKVFQKISPHLNWIHGYVDAFCDDQGF